LEEKGTALILHQTHQKGKKEALGKGHCLWKKIVQKKESSVAPGSVEMSWRERAFF
jgi:hypothetical protein